MIDIKAKEAYRLWIDYCREIMREHWPQKEANASDAAVVNYFIGMLQK